MCGICGAIGGESGVAETRVSKMMAAMVHRGPDEDGVLAEPFAVLGMRRLSIIDLGGGRQPVYNEDGTVGVVFNGEIYNFPQLRSTARNLRPPLSHSLRHRSPRPCLRRMGRALLRPSARDVCLCALGRPRRIAHSGRRRRRPRVLLARDRLGIKPLYYARRRMERCCSLQKCAPCWPVGRSSDG